MKVKKVLRFQLALILTLAMFISTNTCFVYAKCNPNDEQNTNESFSRYYYNQLDENEKAIYDNLLKHRENFLNGDEVSFTIYNYNENPKIGYYEYFYMVKRACKAYTYDNPEVEIWFNNYSRSYVKTAGYTYMKLVPNANKNNDTRKMVTQLEKKGAEIVSKLSGTDAEKLKQIHDWLIKNAFYDLTLKHENISTAYGAIVDNTAICSGFAYAFKYLANLAGLDVIYVTGKFYKAKTNSFISHAWNIAKVDGKYFLIDVTFDTSGKKSTYFLSQINNGIHHIDTYYFKYPF